ncbi:MAG: hypothetical protein K8J31_12135 [Anaerolineae bacterium]|nr:hypothetical protein [Anaerolineae bacterium]
MRRITLSLLLGIVLILAACGGAEQAAPTAEPTSSPAPTATRAPTHTPEPTVDVASLSADNLLATVDALETELAIEERHLSSASGMDGSSVQANIDQIKKEIKEVRALADAAGSGAEATEEATAEVTQEAAGS